MKDIDDMSKGYEEMTYKIRDGVHIDEDMLKELDEMIVNEDTSLHYIDSTFIDKFMPVTDHSIEALLVREEEA